MDFIFPGNSIGTSEEAQAAKGSIEENGIVYSAVVGQAKFQGGIASVLNPKTPRLLQKGDVIYATVVDVFDQIAMLSFKAEQANVVSSEDRAFLRITEVQERGRGYVESFRDFIRIGDVLKAKVIDMSSLGVYVTIAQRGFGVIRAFCSSCRSPLNENLECKNCMRKERRKTP